MHIIEIAPLGNGAHSNQTIYGVTPEDFPVPEGWALIPEGMEIPDSYPFVGVEAENGVVTRLTPGVVPEPGPEPERGYTEADLLSALLGG